jgi:hypothetical protein
MPRLGDRPRLAYSFTLTHAMLQHKPFRKFQSLPVGELLPAQHETTGARGGDGQLQLLYDKLCRSLRLQQQGHTVYRRHIVHTVHLKQTTRFKYGVKEKTSAMSMQLLCGNALNKCPFIHVHIIFLLHKAAMSFVWTTNISYLTVHVPCFAKIHHDVP